MSALLILQMFPMVLALVAIYVILDFIGQYVPGLGLNTQTGLIMVYLGGISGYIRMLKGYFDTIPASMEESARIDSRTGPDISDWRNASSACDLQKAPPHLTSAVKSGILLSWECGFGPVLAGAPVDLAGTWEVFLCRLRLQRYGAIRE